MSRGIYFGDLNSIARKVKKLYFGDTNSKARKVKKVYFGDSNGKARLCFSSGLSMLSNVGQLDYINYSNTCSKVGNYMLHAPAYNDVKTLNKDWVVGTATNFTYNRRGYNGSWNQSYALFCGGNGDYNSTDIDAYDSSLVKNSTAKLGIGRGGIRGGNIGNYAMTVGGFSGWGGSGSTVARYELFDNSLVRVVNQYNSGLNKNGIGAAKAGNYMVLAGGLYSSGDTNIAQSTVATINTSGVLGSATSLPQAITSVKGASSKNHAFFMTTQGKTNVYVYSGSLVLTTLPVENNYEGAANFIELGDNAVLFGSGNIGSAVYSDDVVTYDDNLVRNISEDVSLVTPKSAPSAFNFNDSGVVVYNSNGIHITAVYQN